MKEIDWRDSVLKNIEPVQSGGCINSHSIRKDWNYITFSRRKELYSAIME